MRHRCWFRAAAIEIVLALMLVSCIIPDPYGNIPPANYQKPTGSPTRDYQENYAVRTAIPAQSPAEPFLVTPEPTQEQFCTVKTGTADGILHLRSCAGIDCSVLAYLPENTSIRVLIRGDWSQVLVFNMIGWVNSVFIECE